MGNRCVLWLQVENRVGISLYLWDLATESEVAATRGSTATLYFLHLILNISCSFESVTMIESACSTIILLVDIDYMIANKAGFTHSE